MKKILVWGLIGLVVLAIIGVVAVTFFLDGAVKSGVETVGPKLTGVNVKLDAVKLSLMSGSGKIDGLTLGNPTGYKEPRSIKMGSATLQLEPRTVLSDKVVIRKFEIVGPEITFEGGFAKNNLKDILANLEAATGGGAETNAPAGEAKAGKKLQVDDFLIKDARLNVNFTDFGGYSTSVKIPEIHLTGLGQDAEGITTAELSTRVIREIEHHATDTVKELVMKVKNMKPEEMTKAVNEGLDKLSKENLDKVTKKLGSFGNLLKRTTNQQPAQAAGATNAVGAP